eukprot:SAG11_NODE_22587_length_403_cov_1.026316_2_plen_50_part_01
MHDPPLGQLVDDEAERKHAGGATRFYNLDIDVMPKPGRLLVFHNCYPDSC